MLAGHVMVGASQSLTVTGKVQVDTFPEAPVAVQVTVVVPFENVEPGAGLHTTVADGLTGSVNATTAEHLPGSVQVETGAGHVSDGAPLQSLTTTGKLILMTLTESRVAEHWTVVVPNGKVDPELGTHITLTVPQSSFASTSNTATAVVLPGSVQTFSVAG
jgi:hypothetical protein